MYFVVGVSKNRFGVGVDGVAIVIVVATHTGLEIWYVFGVAHCFLEMF